MLGIGSAGPLGRDEPAEAVRPTGDAARPVAEVEAWVILASVEGVGPVSFDRLLAAFGSARAILERSLARHGPSQLVAATAGPDGGRPTLGLPAAEAVARAAADPGASLAAVAAAGVDPVTLDDPRYPARLRRIELPPPVLFVRGAPSAMDRERAVAVVGTRRPTEAGRATAARIAEAASLLGATIVSGLAYGIDAAAHAAAARAGLPTVAVIGGGHDRLYPAAHRGLAAAIVATGGAIVSEFAPRTPPTRGTFPRRNRLISGLADGTVVVEAGARSGALTTAAWALEQGRSLHLVPGRIDDPTVAGCLAFLREAAPEARVVAGVPELLEDLGLLEPSAAGAKTGVEAAGLLQALGATERVVAGAIVAGRSTLDELVAATRLEPATVLGALTTLELRGLVLDAFGRFRASGALAGARPADAARRGTVRGAGGRAA